jgi:hypothetical protein
VSNRTAEKDGLIFRSSASSAEILHRIRSNAGKERSILNPFAFGQKEDVLAMLKGSRVRLSMRMLRERRASLLGSKKWRYPYAPFFVGEVMGNGSGSVISGHIQFHPSVKWFERVWVVLVTLAMVFGFLLPLSMGGVSANTVVGVIVCPVLLAALPAMRGSSKPFRHEDEKDLIKFLTEVTQ